MRRFCKSQFTNVIGREMRVAKPGAYSVCCGVRSYLGLSELGQGQWQTHSGSRRGQGVARHHKPSTPRTFPMTGSAFALLNVIEDVRAGP